MSKTTKHILWALVAGSCSSIFAVTVLNIGIFKSWENKTYDLRMSFTQKFRPKPSDVVMFYVDEPSLKHMESQGINWPWPRELYSSAIDFCRRGGARAIVFDLFFSEQSVYGVGDDESFAKGLKDSPSYFVLFLTKNKTDEDPRWKTVIQKSSIPLENTFSKKILSSQGMMSLPTLELVDKVQGFGNAALPPDDDGIYRRIQLFTSFQDHIVPSIGLKIASDISKSFDDKSIPLDDGGQMLINYYGPADTFPNYPLAKILTQEIDPAIVKDKVVIIGVAAPGLYDLKPTPLSKTYPGPEIHATVIQNLLSSDFITPLSKHGVWLITALFGIISAIIVSRARSISGIGATFVILGSLLLGSATFLFSHSISMEIIQPFGALSISVFAMTAINYMTEGRKKREIKKAFGQYLSPHVVGEISKNPELLKLGGEVKKVTLFFSDIADFTTISEKTPPEELVSKLNLYFSLTTQIIQDRSGTLDKYIGDAIMAFWGAPLSAPDHALSAIISALEIQKELARMNSFVTRIGIHTGDAVIGNIGSNIRFNYTAIGDTVNLASRLEGLNKKFGTKIIISEPSFNMSSNEITARQIGKVRVKGRTEPIKIYEPLGTKGEFGMLGEDGFNKFGIALSNYSDGKFKEAFNIFKDLSQTDQVSKYYTAECEKFIHSPTPDFDGVITFTTK